MGNAFLYTGSTGRKECPLRIIDVSDVLAAAATENQHLYQEAADAIRAEAVEFDRDDLKAEIGARRYTSLFTSWFPDSWVSSCYPSGYFGLERNPHWVSVSESAATRAESSPAKPAVR